MNATTELRLACADDTVCASLASVLTPDNRRAPRGLTIAMRQRGRVLTVTIISDSPPAAVSGQASVLRDVTLFQEIWLLSHARAPRRMERSGDA